jgi:hypothetical protein
LILNGTKKLCLLNVLKTASTYLGKTIFYYYENAKIVIVNSLSGKNYKVDDYTIMKSGSYLTIFPIPELTLKDKLTYKNVSYNIQSLVFENNKILCEVKAA